MEISQALKEFITKYKDLINNCGFEELYDKRKELLMEDYFVLTLLLNKVGIDPLKYMTYVPVYYMEKFKELTILRIPEGIKTVETEAFYGCTNLKKVYFPSTLQVIESAAFDNCGSLKDIYFNGTTEQWSRLHIDENNDNLYYTNIHCIDGEPFKN